MSTDRTLRRPVAIVLDEHRVEHTPWGGEHVVGRRARGVGSPLLAAVGRCGRACGATLLEHERRSPLNVCVNYYDGGRDVEISHTLSLTFACVADLRAFLGEADSALVPWLAHRRGHAASLQVGTAQISITNERDIALLVALLGAIADPAIDTSAVNGAGPPRASRTGDVAADDSRDQR